uniref:Uncharacterized protein n=1 Tax=Anguilla anguilla TaxID=7936 RepID=A0A0E9QZU9_ANGAN
MCILKVILPPRPKIKHLHTHSYCIYQKNVFHEISCKTSNHYKNNNNSCSMLLIHIKIFAIIIIITEKHSLLTPSLCQNSCLSGNS